MAEPDPDCCVVVFGVALHPVASRRRCMCIKEFAASPNKKSIAKSVKRRENGHQNTDFRREDTERDTDQAV